MPNFDKSTGSAGILRIADNEIAAVDFLIYSGDPATFSGGVPWNGTVNGVGVSGSRPINSGVGWYFCGGWTVTYSQTTHFNIGASGTMGIGGPTNHSAWISRPLPDAPYDLIITRVSDSEHKLNWSRPTTYTSVVVQRTTFDGVTWSGWQQVGIASGNAFTFTDTTTQPNRRYVYRVAGKTSAGQSAWSAEVGVYTTPAAPTGVAASRSGDDIVVTAASVPLLATAFDVEDNGVLIDEGVSLPFTHVAPNPAVPHQYRVRGVAGGVDGVWSALSNTVQLIAPPNAPAGLSPNGGVAPSDGDVLFTWTHNPVDSSEQSSYELRHRAPGGSWTLLSGTTSQQRSVSLPVGAVEWQVRTKGAHPDWSPWSPVATVTVIDRPGVAIQQPDAEWDASTLPVQWSWFQAQGRPQSAWQAELLNSSLVVVETRSGSGADDSATFTTRLTEGNWTVRVRAATGDVWSVWTSESFTVAFDPPAPPVLDGAWDESQGGVVLTVGSGNPGIAVLSGGAWYADFGR